MARPPAHSEAEVRKAVANARSLSDALRSLGLRSAGGNFATLRRLIALWDIPTDHLDPNWAKRGAMPYREPAPLTQVLVKNSTYHRGTLKERLYREGLKARMCEICGQGETWQGLRMSLILDHRNGVHDDNRLENLRIVCPNCNATFDTHCGSQGKMKPRECLFCGQIYQPRHSNQKYCSHNCGSRGPGKGDERPETRKVDRPDYAQLLRDLEESNYSAVGRKYGVSDNAVRKWVRAYEWRAQHLPVTEPSADVESA